MNLINIVRKIERTIENNYRGEINGISQVDRLKQIEIHPIVKSVLIEKPKQEQRREGLFDSISGYENVKKIINSMLDNLPVSILLDGPAGTGKSMFLHSIDKHYLDESVYINGSKCTKAGLFKILFEDKENKIKILCINELDKMDTDTQETLLDLLEEGILSETLKSNVREKRYENISVFATSNDIENLIYPLQTRMFKVKVKAYTNNQFREIAGKVLENQGLDKEVIYHIIEMVLEKKKEPNIRDVKQIGKLCNNDMELVNLLLANSSE